MMRLIFAFALATCLYCNQASAFDLVTSHSDKGGSISVYVANEGAPQEQWLIVVYDSADGETYQYQLNPSTGVINVTTSDMGGPIHSDGTWVMTSFEPGYHGTQVHSNGYVWYPPWVTPPGEGPPTVIRGKWPSWAVDGVFRGQEEEYVIQWGCAGSALAALGAFLTGGGAARAAISGAIRGSLGGPGAAAGWGALSAIAGATMLVVDACMAR